MRGQAAGLAVLIGLAACLAQAAPVAEKKVELRELKGRIATLHKEIERGEKSRVDAAVELRDTGRAIADANRTLRELADRQRRAEAELTQLNTQLEELERSVSAQQQALSQLLHRRYLAGDAGGLARLLSGDDPNQIARDLHFLRYLTRAQADLIESLRQSVGAKQLLIGRAREQSGEIVKLAQLEQGARADLLEKERQRRTALRRIADKIDAQRREAGALKQDEVRLSKLIDSLQRLARRPPPKAKAPRSAAAKQPPVTRREKDAAKGSETPADTAEASIAGAAFARLKGRLKLPAQGELVNRYGALRSAGGTSAKGLFIRALSGQVKAVGSGKIVFADWLRGFGNLLIIDHGGSYLSVYGNNETLYKSVGQHVVADEVIAAIGSSGGGTETGLYFELRHQGQPLDPMRWVNTR